MRLIVFEALYLVLILFLAAIPPHSPVVDSLMGAGCAVQALLLFVSVQRYREGRE